MKFTAVGDVLCQRRMAKDYDGFEEIKSFIEKGDAKFFNLETTVNYEDECYGNQFSGGTYIRCNPEVAADMLDFGFNMTSFNNNHAMDFAHEGLLLTIDYVNDMDITHAGVGRNLHEAASPSYLDTKNGRVALIAINTSFNPAMMAGEQSKRIKGRPGINGVTVSQKVVLPKEDFEEIKRIGDACGINAPKNVTRAEGYYPYPPKDVCELGELQFVLGQTHGVRYDVNADDLGRVIRSIKEAKTCSDYVMVSLHSHQLAGSDKTTVPEFLKTLAHTLIDEGADAIVGHGPHLLRPIEVYKNKPIFYCLGDFVIQLYDVAIAPEDFYKKYGLDSTYPTIELLEKRSAGFTRGLMEDSRMMETVIPYWECNERCELMSLVLMPVKASKGEGKHLEGLPRPAKNLKFIDKLAEMSEPYGVKMSLKNGLVHCEW